MKTLVLKMSVNISLINSEEYLGQNEEENEENDTKDEYRNYNTENKDLVKS
jgi:hypothetical protein